MKVLFAARVDDDKNPVTYVKAALQLPQHTFIVAGDGSQMQKCRELASANVKFTGWVNQEQISRLMEEADVFCQLCSVENIWASSLISALKHGKAIVCTDAGTTSHYLENDVHVLLVPPRSPDALASAISKLSNEGLRSRLGWNAQRFYQQSLSPDTIMDEIHGLLLEVVK